VKCLNNVVEADHGKLKRLIRPSLNFDKWNQSKALQLSQDRF